MTLGWVGVPAPSLRLWEVLLWGSATTGTVKQEERETLLLAGSCTDLGVSAAREPPHPAHPSLCRREDQERGGLSHQRQLSFKALCPEQGPHSFVWQMWGHRARNTDLFFCIFRNVISRHAHLVLVPRAIWERRVGGAWVGR